LCWHALRPRLSNLHSFDTYSPISVAVVDNEAYRSDSYFQSVLDSVSADNPDASDKLFHIAVTTADQAEESLKNNEISGYLLLDDTVHVVVKDSGLNQTILKAFVDSYLQVGSAYTTILQENPAAAASIRYDGGDNFIEEVAPGKTNPDSTVIYFYALIAMACLFGGFWGRKEVDDIQADMSPQAARLNLAPVHKMKAFFPSLCAAITIQFFSVLLLLAYLALVLKVQFGAQLGFIVMTCFFGSILGVLFGALINALIRASQSVKMAIFLSTSLILSFLAGMMIMDVKYSVTHAFPLMAYINPANLISDAFYSLYVYSTYTRFFLNIGLLAAFSILFFFILYLATRRRKYASI
jgi:ABC-2 type transport system permease protein